MNELRTLSIRTACAQCTDSCCSQPYDWVYLTRSEVERITEHTGLSSADFVEERTNDQTGFSFRTLNLPCRFLDAAGRCTIYAVRPLVCRLYPLYPDPMTGRAMLLAGQCGDLLTLLDEPQEGSWRLADYEPDITAWISELWKDATKEGRCPE